jgi:hypothetical protein
MTNLAKMRLKIKNMEQAVEELKKDFNGLTEKLTETKSPLINKKESNNGNT